MNNGPLCNALDIVGHEYTHGITAWESQLIYQDESGAVNEAISDVMGAAIDYYNGASETDTLFHGEDAYTPSTC